jgi:hypothetical protein
VEEVGATLVVGEEEEEGEEEGEEGGEEGNKTEV